LIAQWPQDTIPDLARKRAVDQYITGRLGLPTAGFVVDAAFWHPITRPRLVWCSCWETERREELEASFRELKGDFTFRARAQLKLYRVDASELAPPDAFEEFGVAIPSITEKRFCPHISEIRIGVGARFHRGLLADEFVCLGAFRRTWEMGASRLPSRRSPGLGRGVVSDAFFPRRRALPAVVLHPPGYGVD